MYCLLNPPLAWADTVSKSDTTTATEKVDIWGVSWKCTQLQSVSFNLQTEVTITQPFSVIKYFQYQEIQLYVRWVHVTMAWCILRLWMEEWPPAMEDSCEYIE
jgi:hypothetical protein